MTSANHLLIVLSAISYTTYCIAWHDVHANIYQLADNTELRLRRDSQDNFDGVETNITHDNHEYYNSSYYADGRKFFIDLSQPVSKDIIVTRHRKLSSSYRKAYKMNLGFDFPFYGNVIDYIRVTTGGFVNVGPKFHSFVHLVHYIAPLMADFNPTSNEDTSIYFGQSQNMVIVQWNNIVLNGSTNQNRTFTFQVILCKNGTVVYGYKDIPVSPLNIPNTTHNVTVGFSDGFILTYNRTDGSGRTVIHNFIYSYHKVMFPLKQIKSGSAFKLVPLPNCLRAKDCRTCLSSTIGSFSCRWCPRLNLCSDTLDWHREKWLSNKCHREGHSFSKVDQCSVVPKKVNNNKHSSAIIGSVIGVVLVLLIIFVLCWFYYSYTHPQSKSGMWLIEHHPRRMFKRNFDPVANHELI